jgi:hypothetical protein
VLVKLVLTKKINGHKNYPGPKQFQSFVPVALPSPSSCLSLSLLACVIVPPIIPSSVVGIGVSSGHQSTCCLPSEPLFTVVEVGAGCQVPSSSCCPHCCVPSIVIWGHCGSCPHLLSSSSPVIVILLLPHHIVPLSSIVLPSLLLVLVFWFLHHPLITPPSSPIVIPSSCIACYRPVVAHLGIPVVSCFHPTRCCSWWQLGVMWSVVVVVGWAWVVLDWLPSLPVV